MRASAVVALVAAAIVALLLVDFLAFMLGGRYVDRVLFRRRYAIRKMRAPPRTQPCRAAIVCLARSVGDVFDTARERVTIMADAFQDCRIVVVENDSDDDTRPRLCQWAAADPRVEVVPCPNDTSGQCAQSCLTGAASAYELGPVADDRMARMTQYRNAALEYVKAMRRTGAFSADVVVVYDFDIAGNLDMAAFHAALDRRGEWDALFANGRMACPPLGLTSLVYDGLAFLHRMGDADPLFYRTRLQTEIVRRSADDMVPVASAFNGLGLYEYTAVEGCAYSVPPPPNNCEHVGLHLDMARQGFTRTFIFKPLVLWAGEQGPRNKFKVVCGGSFWG